MQALVFNWTLILPPGFRLASTVANLEQAPPLELARHELARAEAQKAVTTLLVEQLQKTSDDTLKSQIAASQQAFVQHSRLASNVLDTVGSAEGAAQGELKAQLAELERQNLATLKAVNFDKWRVPEDKSPAHVADGSDLSPWRGTIVRWRGGIPAAAPPISLVEIAADSRTRAWAGAGWLLAATVLLLALTLSPTATGWMLQLWPELIGLIGLAGCALWGFSLLGAALLLAAVALRLVWLTARLRMWRRRRQARTPANQLAPAN
jgi:hypothetical protein